MKFDSTIFLFVFLPLALAFYYLVPMRLKNRALMAASILFYAWGSPIHALLVLLLTAWNYRNARMVFRLRKKPKKALVALKRAIFVNILALAVGKCAGDVLALAGSAWSESAFFAAPIGLPLIVLQSISCLVDIYRGEAKPQNSLTDFAVLIFFFPKLTAGPLVSGAEFAWQPGERRITWNKVGDGAMLFVKGLAKKAVLGTSMGMVFSEIQNMGSRMSALTAWLGCAAFALHLFLELDGYSDMARGLGKLFGFELPRNMDYPCLAFGIMDFWKRFFISLWEWFRTYVYTPLCRRFRPDSREGFFCLAFTWILIGLWHGVNASFVVWGLYFAVLLFLEGFVLGPAFGRLPGILQWLSSTVLLFISWVFFFSPSLGEAGGYLLRMIGIGGTGFLDSSAVSLVTGHFLLWVAAVLFQTPFPERLYGRWVSHAGRWQMIVNVVFYGLLFFLSIAAVLTNAGDTFFYWRF